MKLLLLFCLLSNAGATIGQNDTLVKFYNAGWKETAPRYASYYSVSVKNNNAWHRVDVYAQAKKVQMDGYYTDTSFKIAIGPFQYFYKNGQLSSKGIYSNGKKNGIWKSWNEKGTLNDSSVYDDGVLMYHVSYYDDGTVNDSTYTTSKNNTATKSYWQGGSPRDEGHSVGGKREGLWQIFAPEGYKSTEAHYVTDSVVSYTCFDAQGKPVTDCVFEREAEYKGGQKAWVAYLQDAMSRKLPQAFYRGELEGIVVVLFIVDKDGNVTNARIDESTEEKLNNAALKIITDSPRWLPAIQYNRPVKAYRKQPLTFMLSPQ